VIAIVGLDGATWDLAGPFLEAGDMPALGALIRAGTGGVLRSTIPPVTFPAWSSFMTGANPGRHGIFDFTRRVPGTYEVAFVGSRDRRVPTMWKLLSDAGRRVAVLGVPTTYPPEPLNGIMVGGFDSPVATGIDGSFVHPPEFYAEMTRAVGPYAVTDFQELTIGPGWHADALPKILAAVERKRDLARYVLRKESWDCFMVLFGEADTASHHFWMFADPSSPRFDAARAAELGSALRDVYRRLDAALGAIVAELPADATILVASDHGFGGAGTSVLHLNRWLADHGWLAFRRGGRELPARLARGARRAALAFLPRGVQERLVRRGGRDLARRLESWSRFAAIDMGRTRAFSEELNYAPSIWLNVRGRDPEGQVAPGADYDAAVRAAARRAARVAPPETGAAIVARVHRRDEIYDGPRPTRRRSGSRARARGRLLVIRACRRRPRDRAVRRSRRTSTSREGRRHERQPSAGGLWVLAVRASPPCRVRRRRSSTSLPRCCTSPGCRCRHGWTAGCCPVSWACRASATTCRPCPRDSPTPTTRPSCGRACMRSAT
jgi:predicted AlkP superfamily phosphohydrolase/phosphomutase